MRWIVETAFACAASWVGTNALAVYSGGITFYRPILIGNVVEVEARLLHTGPRSLHIAIHVRSGLPRSPKALKLTTHRMSIFVDIGEDHHDRPIRHLLLQTDEDRLLYALAIDLMRVRSALDDVPI